MRVDSLWGDLVQQGSCTCMPSARSVGHSRGRLVTLQLGRRCFSRWCTDDHGQHGQHAHSVRHLGLLVRWPRCLPIDPGSNAQARGVPICVEHGLLCCGRPLHLPGCGWLLYVRQQCHGRYYLQPRSRCALCQRAQLGLKLLTCYDDAYKSWRLAVPKDIMQIIHA